MDKQEVEELKKKLAKMLDTKLAADREPPTPAEHVQADKGNSASESSRRCEVQSSAPVSAGREGQLRIHDAR